MDLEILIPMMELVLQPDHERLTNPECCQGETFLAYPKGPVGIWDICRDSL